MILDLMVGLPLSGHHPVPSSHEVATHGLGMKAHSLIFPPSFYAILHFVFY